MGLGSVISIVTVGLVCPVGLSATTAAAAIRAGICRYRESCFRDASGEPFTLALTPVELLGSVAAETGEPGGRALDRPGRMLRLALSALEQCGAGIATLDPAPLYLALPESHPLGIDFPDESFVRELRSLQQRRQLPLRDIFVYHGRAGGVSALEHAVAYLRGGRNRQALVGGVDSYLDPALLHALAQQGRLRGNNRPGDSFVPGEGACFLLLTKQSDSYELGNRPLACVQAVATAAEPGHRYSQAPLGGDGLTAAIRATLSGSSESVHTVYTGFNGESLHGKEWGVAVIRQRERFPDDLKLYHPADCIGDAGAAVAPILLALAAVGLHRQRDQGPTLIFCSSDHATRGAILMTAAE